MLPDDADDRLAYLRRFSRTIPGADDVLQFFQSKAVVDKMLATARRDIPPVTAVSADLVEALGRKQTTNPQFAKFVGRAVRVLMEEHGLEVSKRNVRVRADPIFTVASTYRDSPPRPTQGANDLESGDLLFRFIDTLSREELSSVQDYVRKLLDTR